MTYLVVLCWVSFHRYLVLTLIQLVFGSNSALTWSMHCVVHRDSPGRPVLPVFQREELSLASHTEVTLKDLATSKFHKMWFLSQCGWVSSGHTVTFPQCLLPQTLVAWIHSGHRPREGWQLVTDRAAEPRSCCRWAGHTFCPVSKAGRFSSEPAAGFCTWRVLLWIWNGSRGLTPVLFPGLQLCPEGVGPEVG